MICKVCVAMDAKLRAYWSSPLPGRFQAEYLTSEGTMAWIPRQRQIGAGRNYFKIEVPIAQNYPGEIKQVLCPLGKLLDLFPMCSAACLCLYSLPSSMHSHHARDKVHSHFPPKSTQIWAVSQIRNLSCMPQMVQQWCLNAMGERCEGEYLRVLQEDPPLRNNPSGSSCPSS